MGLWTVFCGGSNCSDEVETSCSSGISAIFSPHSCINHFLVTSVDMLLLFILLFFAIRKFSSRKTVSSSQPQLGISPLSISSAIFNGGLGLAYLCLGVWTIKENLNAEKTILPLHGWLGVLCQGFVWLLLSLSLSLEKRQAQVIPLRKLCLILGFVLAGFLCVASVRESIVDKLVSVKMVLDMLSFPGAILLLFSAFKGHIYAENEGDISHHALYRHLKGEETDFIGTINSKGNNETPFATAGLLSRMSFWWLNSLMKKGKEKTIKDEDIPHLRKADQAETCYLQFMEQLSKSKQSNLLAILFCQRKAILISGFFALTKILTLSTGPMFLYAFIRIAEGGETFKYETYALTAGLFLAKCLESLSERQWYFQTRLIGLQVRSLLSAAIYQKQLRLSNAAKTTHSPGEIMNYVTVDAYKIGEFPYWFHQIWTTGLQICLALIIIYLSVGLATIAALIVIILTVLGNYPVAKLQHNYLTKIMMAQDGRLKGITEALANMKVLKMYAWETHFKNVIERLRKGEADCLSAVQSQKGYYIVLFWSSPIIVSVATFWACYMLGIPLNTSNVFTFLATLRIVQEPIRLIPDVAGVFIEANVSFTRIVKFLEAPELQNRHINKNSHGEEREQSVVIDSTRISWDADSLKPTLTNINLIIKCGEKVAICGGVGSGKSTLLATILREVPYTDGIVQVYGKIAYVSQTSWIQTGTIQQNILFGSAMDECRYQQVLEKCFLVKDLGMLPFGDGTVIGERGVNLSGGQKQRVQLARALYQDADIYLLDDPFSAVDAHTATGLFNEYVMGALSGKTVLLVTHQVDFLHAFDSVLLMSEGKILKAATYNQLLASSLEFQYLVNAHNDAAFSEKHGINGSQQRSKTPKEEIQKTYTQEQLGEPVGDQLIKQEEREIGNTGLKPYRQYLNQSKGFLYLTLAIISHLMYLVGQLVQNLWLATELDDFNLSRSKLLMIYLVIGCGMSLFLVLRSYVVVVLGLRASKAIFSKLMTSLFRAPMSFYDSTPLGRILSRVSSDMSIVDLELCMRLSMTLASTMTTYFSYGILVFLTWPMLFVIIPTVYATILLQSYYFASSKELMRIDGTTKSSVASHIAESIAGATTIRAFGEEDRFFAEFLHLIDTNASPFFHSFSANEWLIQRLEIICAIVLSCSALAMTLFHLGASDSGYIGMALSYGLSLNIYLVSAVQCQCILANLIISVERLEQYMHIPSEAPEIIEAYRPAFNWPSIGKVEIRDLKVQYRPNAPLVLHGISCIFEGGHKIGIVGRTGSGKTTLISVLFRLVEPTEGMIVIDDLNISNIGLHDLRSRFAVIPQDPTLFSGSVRYNLDPLSEHTDHEIWEVCFYKILELTKIYFTQTFQKASVLKVLAKCRLRELVEKKEEGLDSLVVQDGSNWSMGQRQLFCLGRALLKRRKILVLDEATASIDNATDSVIQRTIRTEFEDCTVITVAHRIPTVMDCTMVLAISDGKLVEYDQPMKLMNKEGSLFGQLVKEYWAHSNNNANGCSEDC
ncbi:ABC transporter C family member 10-like isoform X4 [Camellia sinensis]|uniref:ABC transporter C family member 10-like isoform X4 n=1 Tax=Camellia sinensis TaxID=4442 RepID=UPI0010362F4E|nr:ABC transporter C family member 10-like isoform X4 [Camellia sinensis]